MALLVRRRVVFSHWSVPVTTSSVRGWRCREGLSRCSGDSWIEVTSDRWAEVSATLEACTWGVLDDVSARLRLARNVLGYLG